MCACVHDEAQCWASLLATTFCEHFVLNGGIVADDMDCEEEDDESEVDSFWTDVIADSESALERRQFRHRDLEAVGAGRLPEIGRAN